MRFPRLENQRLLFTEQENEPIEAQTEMGKSVYDWGKDEEYSDRNSEVVRELRAPDEC